jgi:hypothetical protein
MSTIANNTDESSFFKYVLARFDGPAYIRRGRRTEESLGSLLDHCRFEYDKGLAAVRKKAVRLLPLIDKVAAEALRELFLLLGIALDAQAMHPTSEKSLRRALSEFRESVDRFNSRWKKFLERVDLTAVNEARAGYNRYYLLEKECAVGSLQIAKQGFTPLQPLTIDDLLPSFPFLPPI